MSQVIVKFYNEGDLATVEDIINAYAHDEGGTTVEPKFLGSLAGKLTKTITWTFPTMWRACWFVAKLSNSTTDIVRITMDATNLKEA
jgi:hypothetical protein